MSLVPLVLSATTSPCTAGCNACDMESIFDLHYAELNEIMEWAKLSNFGNSQQHAVTFCLQRQKHY